MTTYLGKSSSFCLPRVPFVNCRQFMYLVISLLVLRAGYGIWLYQFLIIAYLFTLLFLYFLVLWDYCVQASESRYNKLSQTLPTLYFSRISFSDCFMLLGSMSLEKSAHISKEIHNSLI